MKWKLEINHMPRELPIGYVGETDFRTFEINMQAWLKEIPDGQASIICIRPQETEEEAYITMSTMDENGILYWTPTEADLGVHEGYGEIQIWLEKVVEGTTTKRGKSVRVKTRVEKSITSASEQIPSGQESWMEQMTLLKNATVTAAASAAQDADEAASAAEDAESAAHEANNLMVAARDYAQAALTNKNQAVEAAGSAINSAAAALQSAGIAGNAASTATGAAAAAATSASNANSDKAAAANSASKAATYAQNAMAARDGAAQARSNAESAAQAAGSSAANASTSERNAASSAGEASQAADTATSMAETATNAKNDAEAALANVNTAIEESPEMVFDTANYFVLCHASVNPVLTTMPSESIEVDGETHTVYPYALCAETIKEHYSEWDSLKDDDIIALKPVEDYVVPTNRYYPTDADEAPYMNVYIFYGTNGVPTRPHSGRRVFIRVSNMSRIQYPVGTKLFEKGHVYLFRFKEGLDELTSRRQVDILDWNTAENDKAKSVSTAAALEAEKITYGTENGQPVPSTDSHHENNANYYLGLIRQAKTEAEALLIKEKLLDEMVPDTTQAIAFDQTTGNVQSITHSSNGVAVRTDVYTFGTNTITEVRTLSTGQSLTIVTNTETLATTITYDDGQAA